MCRNRRCLRFLRLRRDGVKEYNMSQLQAILKYQETDKKLYALERELQTSNERKEYVKQRKFLEGAAEKLDAFEQKAKQLAAMSTELSKAYLAFEENLKEYENLDELLSSGADVSFYKKNALAMQEQVKKIRADLTKLTAEINATDAEYKKLKSQVVSAQKLYKDAQAKYGEVKASKDDERKSIEAELSSLAKDIEKETMEKYLNKRKEKIFPVVGQIQDNRCPFCGMAPPIAAINSLGAGKTIECENCRRVIYKE